MTSIFQTKKDTRPPAVPEQEPFPGEPSTDPLRENPPRIFPSKPETVPEIPSQQPPDPDWDPVTGKEYIFYG